MSTPATTAPSAPEARAGQGPGAVTPDTIMQTAMGFMAAKHLVAANELGVFEALGQGPANLDELAARDDHRVLRSCDGGGPIGVAVCEAGTAQRCV